MKIKKFILPWEVMKKPLSFATHTLALALGFAGTVLYNIEVTIPNTYTYIHPLHYEMKLRDGTEKYYQNILGNRFIVNLLLDHPLYFYNRDRAYGILMHLIQEGHTPSAKYGFKLAVDAVRAGATDLYWAVYQSAKMAADQGSPMPIAYMFTDEEIYQPMRNESEDFDKDLEQLKALAKGYYKSEPAHILADYFEKLDNTEEAQNWREIAKSIDKNGKPKVAKCEIVNAIDLL